jgi:hypothetical protein
MYAPMTGHDRPDPKDPDAAGHALGTALLVFALGLAALALRRTGAAAFLMLAGLGTLSWRPRRNPALGFFERRSEKCDFRFAPSSIAWTLEDGGAYLPHVGTSNFQRALLFGHLIQ